MNARLHRSGHGLRTLLAWVLGMIVAAAILVGVRTEITSLRYELQKLRNVESRLRRDVEKLRIETAVLTAPERLEARALELGMTYPRSGQVISLPARGARRASDRAPPASAQAFGLRCARRVRGACTEPGSGEAQ